MATIEKVWAREVLDSRGNPTVEAEITAGGRTFTAIAPERLSCAVPTENRANTFS